MKMTRFCILVFVLCLVLSLAGCSSTLPTEAIDGEKWREEWVLIGNTLGVDAPESFSLLENMDILAAEGLYYATWATGGSVPFENSDGESVELYDAQLYLLFNEAVSEEAALKNCQGWISSAESNYEAYKQDIVVCNGQEYTLLVYDCVGEDTPYKRGASALGVCGANAVCAELTCVEGYEGDLEELLTEFLEGCHYGRR